MGIKQKHQGAMAICILMVSIFATLSFVGYSFWFIENNPIATKPIILPQISVPSSKEIRMMRQLLPKLETLSVPSGIITGAVALEPFGYRRPEVGVGQAGGKPGDLSEESNYTLTLTFSSGTRRFCIIDGAFYPKGGVLPDGARIAQIRPHKVLIRKKERQIWIPLSIPKYPKGMQTMSKKSTRGTGG
ncbi:MAG: hypothetical protein PVI90_11400 [Desulfobacteraceae bacterium]|jgi:hypothetical protein